MLIYLKRDEEQKGRRGGKKKIPLVISSHTIPLIHRDAIVKVHVAFKLEALLQRY
jgi:hypothetical protein